MKAFLVKAGGFCAVMGMMAIIEWVGAQVILDSDVIDPSPLIKAGASDGFFCFAVILLALGLVLPLISAKLPTIE